jgi:hypothetical protein
MKRLACLFFACVAAAACACDTAVRGYAKSKWRADEYELILFHRGAGSATVLAELPEVVSGGTADLMVREWDLKAHGATTATAKTTYTPRAIS